MLFVSKYVLLMSYTTVCRTKIVNPFKAPAFIFSFFVWFYGALYLLCRMICGLFCLSVPFLKHDLVYLSCTYYVFYYPPGISCINSSRFSPKMLLLIKKERYKKETVLFYTNFHKQVRAHYKK